MSRRGDAPIAPRRVLLLGATGLVGRACLDLMRDDARVAGITVLQRRAETGDARVRVIATDFDRLDALPAAIFAVDVVLCALGTTIRRAGSQAAFRRVDHDYPLAVARRARAAGATVFALVSAIGADPQARVFYTRVKGETERALGALGFGSLVIARPSLLLGDRAEFRLGERLAAPVGRLLPRRWRAVEAGTVARALVQHALAPVPGLTVLENPTLLDA